MVSPQSKLRRSLERAGPLAVALVLGAVLVASSGLSYRDARLAAGLVAERQGIGLLHREPIGSADAVGRALNVLWLSSGAAILLAAAALILATKARRADRMDAQLSAQRHLARLGEMSAVLAHEMRNPLAALKGHAQLLGERVVEPDLAARVDRVVTEAIRLEQLTNDLLEFARSGAIRIGPASPAELMERAARATDPTRVECNSGGAPDVAQVDGPRIEQVLINLIENALQVTPPALTVQVAASAGRGGLILTVRDHGPGVPIADRARIFEPFHTTKTRGTGLGLAVASRIVELHGGRIDVLDADPGAVTDPPIPAGTIFRVFLPAGIG